MNFKRRIGNSEIGFQMGPMLDIIFILLIQFMVATMFANRENWFRINVPVAANGSESQEQVSEILLNVRENGELYLDKGFSDTEGTSSKGEPLLTSGDWAEDDTMKPGKGMERLKSELERFHIHNRSLKVIRSSHNLSPPHLRGTFNQKCRICHAAAHGGLQRTINEEIRGEQNSGKATGYMVFGVVIVDGFDWSAGRDGI